MVTMKDVAKTADVSMATVSRVIAGNVFVKASTYDKVMKAVEKLGFDCSPPQGARIPNSQSPT